MFEIHDPEPYLPNQLYYSVDSPMNLDSVCPKSAIAAGEVTVAAGVSDLIGLQAGTISQCSAPLWYQGSFMSVRQVTLENPLSEYRIY